MMTSDNTSDELAQAGGNPENQQQETPESEQGAETPAETSEETATQKDSEAGAAGTAGVAGIVAGGAAVLSAGIGLLSLTGTSLGEMLRTRQEIVGQLEAAPGGGGEIEAFYETPWNTVAMLNGGTALLAVLIGVLVLALVGGRSAIWVKAVAVGGVALGVIGVLIAGGMYFDLFADVPEMPEMPMQGG